MHERHEHGICYQNKSYPHKDPSAPQNAVQAKEDVGTESHDQSRQPVMCLPQAQALPAKKKSRTTVHKDR